MSNLLTREETMARLRLKAAHFSKLVNGKVRGSRRCHACRSAGGNYFGKNPSNSG